MPGPVHLTKAYFAIANVSQTIPMVSPEEPDQPDKRRRWILRSLGLLGLIGAGGAAGYRIFANSPEPSDDLVNGMSQDELRDIAARYAPDFHFDRREKWFPTDALRYSTERDGETIVDGFHALTEYTRDFHERGQPPAPTVYWHAHDATETVFVIQYWMYSVFDQFTVNFHWHDWELVQVFIEAETLEPVLISASAHSRASPNNEFIEPNLSRGRHPVILAELGSHSSATDMNDQVSSFERFPDGSIHSDITNDWLDVTDRIQTPFSYGLPRDEGARLPVVLPELEDVPLYDHPRLSDDVGPEDFLDEDVTVRGWRDLARPPTDLPEREAGLVMTHADSATAADVTYDLQPTTDVEAITDFTGPQLSFEFPIPSFVEERYADHITSVGIPWEQPRYENPLCDVSDYRHRLAIQGTETAELLDRVVGRFTILVSGTDGVVDAMTEGELEDHGGLVPVSRAPVPVELAVRLASPEPVMVPTNDGVFGFLGVEAGEHLLGATGPGLAPVAVRFTHDGGTVQLGADGRLTVVANADRTWIRGDGRETTGISHVRVLEDFVGPVYAGQPVEDDRFAVAVHRDGRYIVEVRDRDGVRGAVRVVPGERDEVILDEFETGKVSLVRVLADYLASTVALAIELCEGCELLTTYVGPQGAPFEDPERIRAATRRDEVAVDDRVAVRLETAGMADVTAEAALASIAAEFRLIEGQAEPRAFDDGDPGVAMIAGETGVYVTIDMDEAVVEFAPGQTWEVEVSIPGEAPIPPTRFEIVERAVQLVGEPDRRYRVPASPDAIIAGTATMAPGTVLSVRVMMEGAFRQAQEVAIDESGRFGATFDFSERRIGEVFEIEIAEGDQSHFIGAVEVAEEPSVDSFEFVEGQALDAAWDVIGLIGAAAAVGDRLTSTAGTLTAAEMNEELEEARSLVGRALDRLTAADLEGFDQTGTEVLAKRLEDVIERIAAAMETRV